MDATKLDYTLANPSRYTPATMKNQDPQVLFSVSSQLETNSFDLARNFSPLSVAQFTGPPYPYSRTCDIVLPSDHHRASFPQSQEAPLTDVTTCIYDSVSSSYSSNPQPSQSPYHLSSGHEAFHLNNLNMNEDLSAHSVSLSINSSLGFAIQNPPPAFSSIPSNYSAVRRYHEDQSRQHAQILQQLTRSPEGRRQPSTEHVNGDGVLLASLEITPTGRGAEFYHATSSIPMSNIRLHHPRPPEQASLHVQQSKPFNQFQYPYYRSQELGYPDNCRPEPFDGCTTHVLTPQGIGIYENAQQQPAPHFPVSIKTVHIPSPSASNSNSTTFVLESGVYTRSSGPRSDVIQSIPQPSTNSFEGTTGPSKVHPTTSVPDVAPIPSPVSALTNGTGHEEEQLGNLEDGTLIEVESENGDEEKSTSERKELKEIVTENVASNHPGASAKRRDRKQSEGSGATGRQRTGDAKSDPVIKDGLSPPTKKRKKSKMHECQVCHKNFPRPSGLKTHMNTHNNERPYPCPFPGCNRNFGVRSNAKRHLRTHGVIPPQNTGAQPYVVDFSTPMVLEQDATLRLNDEEGPGSAMSDDDRVEGVPHTRRSGRSGRGRGRQFKLRWMPPSSSSRSGAVKGKGKKKPTSSPPVDTVELQGNVDIKPSISRSPSQRNAFRGDGEEEEEEEDGDAHTDGEEDTEMDFGDENDDQDDESEAEDVDRSEEEFGASTAMHGAARFRPALSQHSQASSSRTSLSSSLSASVSASTGSTSATSLPPSASSSTFNSVSPIHAEYFVDHGA